ncbi:MAG: SurA N-terminal domain-containing protein, partial [Christensenellales bacterium]
MKKTALISLILACVMLAGCSLIVKDPQVDGARIVIDVNGESMNKQEFMEKYNSNVQLQRQMEELYRAYGMQAPAMSEEELLENTIDDIVRNKVLEQKAKEHKLDVLSEEENKEAEKEANTRWDNITAGIKSQFFKDSELSEKELNKA